MTDESESRYRVILTAGFNARLDEIERFFANVGATSVVEALLMALHETVIPNLARFPRMGRRYGHRGAPSEGARAALEGLPALHAGALREYLHGDYLMLYAVTDPQRTVHLLSIRHHRQWSFDPAGWEPPAR